MAMACTACGEPIGDEAIATFAWAGFLPSGDALLTMPDRPDLHVHERCRADWAALDNYHAVLAYPALRERERRCQIEARRQSVPARKLSSDAWTVDIPTDDSADGAHSSATANTDFPTVASFLWS